ncbi:MAG: tetratricopeptide repeat protein [Nitrospiraceae bacterium]|nr:tetratricopeptide repeat protein [Nitrospiraceae bacterium]
MKERRKHQRFGRVLELEFSVRDEECRGVCRDISREGCFISTDGSFSPGEIVHLCMPLPDQSHCRLMGIIRWAGSGGPWASKEKGIGVEIIDQDEKFGLFAGALESGDRISVGPEQSSSSAESEIIACPACGVKNRIPGARLSEKPRCGRCGTSLDSGPTRGAEPPAPAAPGRPVSQQPQQPEPAGTAALSLRVGDTIAGRYQIHEVFGGEGRSAMGIVCKCYDLEHDRILALKTLQQRFLDSRRSVDSFKKEALAWIHLEKHPHIVRAYWVRELGGKMFIGCEFITPDEQDRNSLTPYIKGHFSLKRVLTWAIQFCYGMEYAFSRGVTPHRDIKPDNIMITLDGDVKITDFGLVGLWRGSEQTDEIKSLVQKNESELSFLSSDGRRIVAGSPPWMAPEQFYGVAEVSTDIYSFGIVLFQMVSKGEHPFRLRRGDSWRVAHKEYPIPLVPERGAAIAAVITKCLQKRRDKRYRDFGELRKDLEDIFAREITKKTGEIPPPAPEVARLEESELINKGMSLANLGLIDEGIKSYREGLKRNPDNADAHYNLGNALARKGRLGEAITEYRKAIGIDSELTAAHFNLGIALFNDGRIEEAIRAYEEAIRTDPGLTEAYVNLGVAYHKKGRVEDAIKTYKEVLRVNSDYAEAHYKLGLAFFAIGRLDEAMAACRDALRVRPDYAEAHNNLGTVLATKGMPLEAASEYRMALAIRPGYADAHYNLGLALARNNLYREAADAFAGFLSVASPGDPRVAKAREYSARLKGNKNGQ